MATCYIPSILFDFKNLLEHNTFIFRAKIHLDLWFLQTGKHASQNTDILTESLERCLFYKFSMEMNEQYNK